MLRITITDTKTNETKLETFARCICAGITEDDTESRCIFYKQGDEVTGTDAAICLVALDDVRGKLLKVQEVKNAYLKSKLFGRKERKVVE